VPLGDGSFVDMQHFLAAASLSSHLRSKRIAGSAALAIGAGIALEVRQLFQAIAFRNEGLMASAFSSEDIPSNNLGALFEALYYDSTKPLADQVEEFLNLRGAITIEDFKEKYPDKYAKLPESERAALEGYLK
jgi:hypothetical protein